MAVVVVERDMIRDSRAKQVTDDGRKQRTEPRSSVKLEGSSPNLSENNGVCLRAQASHNSLVRGVKSVPYVQFCYRKTI